jgi:hypothetical protein
VQFPVTDTGVTIYWTDPAVEFEGFVRVWLIELAAPAVAPVIPPVIVPIVQLKLAGALDVRLILVLVLLQIDVVAGLVTTGVGFTVTVMVYGAPAQLPVVEVGVTIYSTVPDAELLGFVSVWLIVAPDPALAPVMLPVIFPMVHANVLGAVAARAMFGLVALQIATVEGFVTAGVGFTVTVIVYGAPGHVPVVDVGVTIYWTVPAAELLGLFSVWLIVLPLPEVAPVIPPLMVPIVQLNVLGAVAVNAMFGLVALQIDNVFGLVTAGVGLTVTVIV